MRPNFNSIISMVYLLIIRKIKKNIAKKQWITVVTLLVFPQFFSNPRHQIVQIFYPKQIKLKLREQFLKPIPLRQHRLRLYTSQVTEISFINCYPISLINIFIMRSTLKICNKLVLKSQKQFQLFKRREERQLAGTPLILLCKSSTLSQQIWNDDLKQQCLSILKELNSNQKAFAYARRVVETCISLAPIYGYFILNQNMVFFNSEKEIFTWINPDILENRVKIYLPPTAAGEEAMIRSIIIFLKLWLRCDFALLIKVKHLSQLLPNLKPLKHRQFQHLNMKLQERFLATRQCSVNLHEVKSPRRKVQDSTRLTEQTAITQKTGSIKGPKLKHPPSRGSEESHFAKNRFSQQFKPHFKIFTRSYKEAAHKTVTQASQKKDDVIDSFYHKSFANVNLLHSNTFINKSIGCIKPYFPNKTTSSKNHIVKMILEHDDDPNDFTQNNILIDEDQLRMIQEQKRKKMKISAHGVIGEELNDLFQSGILQEQSSIKMLESQIKNEFKSLLE